MQLIGQLFEVGAFLERKETTVVHKSTDIRTRLLERLGTLTDVKVKDEGRALMDEIKGGDTVLDAVYATPTEGVDALEAVAVAVCTPHTVPNIQTSKKNEGVGVSKNPDTVLDFDKE